MSAIDATVLAGLLRDAQSNQPEIIRRAELSLQNHEAQPGFGYLLARFVNRQDLAPGDRQLSAILLKKFVRAHWDPDADHFEVSSPQI